MAEHERNKETQEPEETPGAEEPSASPQETVGEALAEAAQALAQEERQATAPPRGRRARESLLLFFLAANLAVLGLLAWALGRPSQAPPQHTAPVPPPPRAPGAAARLWEEAVRIGREGGPLEAVRWLERRLEGGNLPPADLLLAYQQLALQCRLAGLTEEAVRYGAVAQALSQRIWSHDAILDRARAARQEGRADDERRLLARFLLLEAALAPASREKVPLVVLRLGDSFFAALGEEGGP